MDQPTSATHGFLFADLRDYTRFVEARGDLAAAALLQEYRQLVREVIGHFRGAEIRTEGDSFFVVFPSASSAVQAGLSILAAVDEHNRSSPQPIRVGIGVHAGEAAATTEGLVGSAINITARVCAQARVGELLVTDTVRSLTRTLLPVRFDSRGSPRLKGIEEPILLYRVASVAAGADATSDRRAGGPRRRNNRQVALIGGVALALALVAGGVALALGLLGGGSGSPSPASATGSPPNTGGTSSISPTPTEASPSATATPPTPSDSHAYPTTLEGDLLSRMPDTVLRGACRRAVPGEAAAKAIASIHCDLAGANADADAVTYDRFESADQMQSFVIGTQDQYRLVKGSCKQQPTAWQQWSFGGFQGKLLCFVDADGHAGVLWSYESSNIVARAARTDGMSGALYAWWTETSALMVR